jgi:putative ABC transport system permease protein
MFKNHFKLAWRNLIKDRQFTILNLAGLSAGLACALLIYLWIKDELQVDTFNEKDKQLYQVMKTAPNADGTISTFPYTPGLLAQRMARQLPEVEYSVAVRHQDIGILSVDNKKFKAKSEFVGEDFFNVFSYQLIEGNKSGVFADKYGVLLSDKFALKLFNTTKNIIGKTFSWKRGEFTGTYAIAGVFKAPPADATDQFDLLFTYAFYATKEAADIAFWGSNGVMTYLILKKGTDIRQFNKKIKDFTRTQIKSTGKDDGILKYEGDVFVERYSERYLHNRYENGVQSGGKIEYVKLFSIIAVFILVIACINFMNLSTAKASKRIKEIGIKKVMGATRSSLVLQYLGESMFMALLSMLIALAIVILLLPAFKAITGKDIQLELSAGLISSAIAITFITGIIAGSYPALYLSGFKPVLVLKSKLSASAGESLMRKGLVVFQFSISIILIVSVLVIYQQMKLVQNTNLGYNKDNIIRFPNDGKLKESVAPFLAALKKIPGVVNATDVSGDFFGNTAHSGGGISWEGKDPNLGIEYYGLEADYDFTETMGMQMAEGRSFSNKFGSDSAKVIFNEAAVKAMGLTNPVGRMVSLWGKKAEIIGIAKDYHFESLYKKVGPSFIVFSKNNDNTLVKIKAGTEQATISQVKNIYKAYNEGLPFDYKFLDEDYQALYSSEQRVGVLSRCFAGIAILISCLGLFGLSAFTAQRRQKEIGIRKVVGASVSRIAFMLSADFVKLVLISVLIATPVSWWAANKWLEGFAYRIPLTGAVFLVAGSCIVIITLITVSFQTIKAAIANPVKSLRSE